MGRTPSVQGIVVSFEGGYLYQAGPDVTGYGTSTSAIPIPLTGNEVVRDVLVSPEDGYFIGGSVGFTTGAPYLFGFFHRIEVSGLYGEADDSARSSVPPAGDVVLTSVDGGVIGINGTSGRTTVERTTWETALRFEGDDRLDSTTTVTYVIAPFVRGFEEDSRTTVTACCDFGRTSSVDTTLYGVFVAAEPEDAGGGEGPAGLTTEGDGPWTLSFDGDVPYVDTFGDVPEGEPLLYFNSLDNVSLAINFGDFASTFGVSSGPEWRIEISR